MVGRGKWRLQSWTGRLDIWLQGLDSCQFPLLGPVSLFVQWGWVELLSNAPSASRIQRKQVPSPGVKKVHLLAGICSRQLHKLLGYVYVCACVCVAGGEGTGFACVWWGVLVVDFGLLTSAELSDGSRIGTFLPLYPHKVFLQQ